MDLTSFEETLGYRFSNRALLLEALTHRSALSCGAEMGAMAEVPRCYERLEFLGDSVLGLIISSNLIARHENFAEGSLSKIRACLVNERALADLARRVSLGKHLILGRSEELSGGRDRDSILADSVEAVIGAVYLDGGFLHAQDVVEYLFSSVILGPLEPLMDQDYKTSLQELIQKWYKVTPCYSVVEECGPDHSKTFEVAVVIEGVQICKGRGASKKEASQVAARAALDRLPTRRHWDARLGTLLAGEATS